jgi:hypothetical protein
MVESILASKCHVVVTMRSKMEYVLEPDEKGKMVPRKVGMEPIQRAGLEYEFDLVCDMDLSHLLTVSKSRCSAVDGAKVPCPGPEFMTPIITWLNEGTEPVAIPATSNGNSHPTGQLISTESTSAFAAPANPTPADYSQSMRRPCDADQQQRILGLAETVGMSLEELRAVIHKRGVDRLAMLSFDQAVDLAIKLEAVANEGNIPF